jgi:hypothetical protein
MSTISKKTKPLLLRFIGSGLLLLSFIFQNFIYDYWDKKADGYILAHRDFSDMNRTSLSYLNLFFNTNLENDSLETVIKSQYILMAARKQAQGQCMDIIGRENIEKQKRINICNSIIQNSTKVHDYDTYLDFLLYINNSYADANINFTDINFVEKLNHTRTTARWLFLISFVLGSLILLLGIKYE